MSDISNISLYNELAKLVEAGINKYINSSIIYSPFRLALNLFKKSNPETIAKVRSIFAADIEETLRNIDSFDEEIFFYDGGFSKKGHQLRKLSYNVGIRLMKNEINLRKAFQALKNNSMREQIYEYLLTNVKKSAEIIMNDEYDE